MADVSKEDLWNEVIELRKKLAKKEKLRKKYFDETKQLKAEMESFEPNLISFRLIHGPWLTIHFIPENFGFAEQVKRDDTGTVRIYHKDSVAMTQLPNNRWMIAKTIDKDGEKQVQRAEFEIHNQFEGYHVLKAFGVDME